MIYIFNYCKQCGEIVAVVTNATNIQPVGYHSHEDCLCLVDLFVVDTAFDFLPTRNEKFLKNVKLLYRERIKTTTDPDVFVTDTDTETTINEKYKKLGIESNLEEIRNKYFKV